MIARERGKELPCLRGCGLKTGPRRGGGECWGCLIGLGPYSGLIHAGRPDGGLLGWHGDWFPVPSGLFCRSGVSERGQQRRVQLHCLLLPAQHGAGTAVSAERGVPAGRAALSLTLRSAARRSGSGGARHPTREGGGVRTEPLRSGGYLRYGRARAAVTVAGVGRRDDVRGGGAGSAACSAPRGASPSRARWKDLAPGGSALQLPQPHEPAAPPTHRLPPGPRPRAAAVRPSPESPARRPGIEPPPPWAARPWTWRSWRCRSWRRSWKSGASPTRASRPSSWSGSRPR